MKPKNAENDCNFSPSKVSKPLKGGQYASLGYFSRKTVTLLLITIRLLLRVHLKDISVFFALKNIKRFECYKR